MIGSKQKNIMRILMVEDSEPDVYFVRRALKKVGSPHFFHAVGDGVEAMRYLRAEPPYSDRKQFPFPTVLLTDLKMPRMGGFDLLRQIRLHSHCRVIPTIVYTSSSIDSDVECAYELGANAYMEKPHDLDVLVEMIAAFEKFWGFCRVPPVPVSELCT